MIFKTILQIIKRFFDVFCYLLAVIFVNYGAFSIYKPLVWFSLAFTCGLTGWLSEWIADQKNKGGGK
ncbi:hypothetical protein ATX19_09465 [Oenococcus oeni]|uniref:DUF1056 family protein n=1 Tax=Oenococcus oeni TaxID=1247 RepID=UPI0008F83350|nr:DUF1056 family protein [Oenococcus oeni]OIL49636.1 hypothetical protein ATX19_09465 [Oenococcus oeni]